MRGRIISTLLALPLLLALALPASAVTQKEMEQARTITAFWYLRYANDGAGYMEEGKTPSTMAELEKMLKETERKNLKAFKAVTPPADYASWDKAKLVQYWGTAFFNSSGLTDKGKVAKSRVQKKLNAMTIAPPAPAAPAAAPTPAAGQPAPENPQPQAGTPAVQEELASAEEIVRQTRTLDSAAQTVAEAEEEEAGERAARRSSSGSTWIYIVALIVLVGIVVWLVIFASKTMQNGNGNGTGGNDASAPDGRGTYAEPEQAVTVVPASQPAAPVAEPGETRAMRREIKGLREECMRMGEENGRLQSDLAEARREIEALRGRLRAAEAVTTAASATSAAAEVHREAPHDEAPARAEAPRRQVTPVEETEEIREIYLGRVNPKGLFVRADRRPVPDKSVFVLTTADGYTGSYRVIQTEEVIERCLDNPDHYLAGGCTAPDILGTDGCTQIRTLQAGTAIFESGCWRMIRKSKIAYE